MIQGRVDDYGRALIPLQIKNGETILELEAWVDTGFTGKLLLRPDQVEKLQLKSYASAVCRMANGTQAVMDTFQCWVEWFGQSLDVQAISGDVHYALIGIHLLEDVRLIVDYPNRTTTVELAIS